MTYVTKVVSTLGRIGETTVWGGLRREPVDPSGPPGDLGSTHLLHCSDASERPEITVRDPWELFLDTFEQLTRDVQAVVGTVLRLGVETHGGIVAVKGGGVSEALRCICWVGWARRTCHRFRWPCRRYQKSAMQDEGRGERRNRLQYVGRSVNVTHQRCEPDMRTVIVTRRINELSDLIIDLIQNKGVSDRKHAVSRVNRRHRREIWSRVT